MELETVWSGTHETAWVKAQQVPAPPSPPSASHVADAPPTKRRQGAWTVAQFLSLNRGWHTAHQIIAATGVELHAVYAALTYYRRKGVIERRCESRGRKRLNEDQRYRWARRTP